MDYDYLLTGEMTRVRENGATSGIGVLATFAYDDLGNRTSLTRGTGTATSYTYDLVSRLTVLNQDLAGTASDLLIRNIAYNPASQITSLNRTNDAYAYSGFGSDTTNYTVDGLNRVTAIAGSTVGYDANKNLTTEPQSAKNYLYTSENLLRESSGGGVPAVSLTYDPLMRLYQSQENISGIATRWTYDGLEGADRARRGEHLEAPVRLGTGRGRAFGLVRRRRHHRPPLAPPRRAWQCHRAHQRRRQHHPGQQV